MGHFNRHDDLREACVGEALAIIEADGLERLSLREVARRLGVSHQAPYRHFPSREHILAEVMRRAYDAFSGYLGAVPRGDDPYADLEAMGQAYLRYARQHPLQYRLMFGTALPDPTQHPEMLASARQAFGLLHACIMRIHAARAAQEGGWQGVVDAQQTALDALFIWSSLHGLAGILNGQTLHTLGLPDTVLDAASAHIMARVDAGLRTESA